VDVSGLVFLIVLNPETPRLICCASSDPKARPHHDRHPRTLLGPTVLFRSVELLAT